MANKSILYIITKSVWGGAAKYVYDLSSEFKKQGYDVNVAAGGEGEFTRKIRQEDIPYFNIKSFQRNVSFLKDFLAFFEVLKLLFKIKPDIIHVNSPKAGGIVGAAALFYKLAIKPKGLSYNKNSTNRVGENNVTQAFRPDKIKTIYTPHGWAFSENRPNWQIFLIKLFSKITCLFYDKVICVSEYDMKKAMEYHITSPKKLTVVYNGIDIKNLEFLDKKEARKILLASTPPLRRTSPPIRRTGSSANNNEFSSLSLSKGENSDDLIIGTIAEMTKNKGLIYLLDAFRKLQKPSTRSARSGDNKHEHVLVIIASGENPDKEKILNYIEENNIENVIIKEDLPEAYKYLKAFDIFVLASIKEGLPYSIIEAMSAGLPVIGTNVGGVPELIKQNGIIIPPKDSRKLAEKIEFLINNPEKAGEHGQNAEKTAKEKFSLENMVKETEKVYLEIT